MKKEKVTCWPIQIENGSVKDKLFISYPEGEMGHMLISCLNCGEIYSVNIAKEIYIGPSLKQKLATLQCVKCSKMLANHFAEYPETFLSSNGDIRRYHRENRIPHDEDSIVMEFWEIYSN